MSRGEKAFSVLIRVVFLIAFASFLGASIHHIAAFFHSFEPDPTGSNWFGSYALAFSVDGTALVLTIGMMFFGKSMPWYAQTIVWFFIIGLTGFSWIVNWEYAQAFQDTQFTTHLNPVWVNINPVLASSFAFLNLAYSIVSEFFGTKPKTLEQLQAERDALTGERAQLEREIKEARGSIIKKIANTAKEVKTAATEVLAKDDEKQTTVTFGAQLSTQLSFVDNSPNDETVMTQLEEQIHVDSFSENETVDETPEKLFPVIEDEEDETDLFLDDEIGDKVFESGHTTDPLPIAQPDENLNETNNISFLHSTGVTKNETNVRAKSTRGAAAKRAEKVIKKYPNVSPTELSTKAKITPAYARKLLAQWTTESETSKELKG